VSWRLITPPGAETFAAVTATPAPVGVGEGGEGSCPFPFPPTPLEVEFSFSVGAAPSVLLIASVPEAAGALEGRGCGASAVDARATGELRVVDTCGRGGFVDPGDGLARGLVVRGGARVEDAPARRVSAGSQKGENYEVGQEGVAFAALQRGKTYWAKASLLLLLLRMLSWDPGRLESQRRR